MYNNETQSEDRAIHQMRYTPDRRIRTESAAARAIRMADCITRRAAFDDEPGETALFVALHTCAFRALGAYARQGAEAAECRTWAARWRLIREYIVGKNLGLAYSMMSRLRSQNADHDDVLSEGLTALARAVERFDPWRGIRFSTYACNLIVRDLINASKRAARYRRMFPHQHEVSFERPEPVSDARTDLYVERLQRALDKNLAGLTGLESSIIRRRFPTDRPKRETLQQIGDAIGVSKERVRQIQMKALDKLRDALSADPVLR